MPESKSTTNPRGARKQSLDALDAPAAMAPELLIVDDFVQDHAEVFAELRDHAPWETSMKARHTASCGVPYNYAQMVYPAAPMLRPLVPVLARLQERLGITFNNCLLNYYLNERSKMGFHADETKDLQPGTGVAIVSLGHPRNLTFRRKDNIEVRAVVNMQPGALLYMESAVQDSWVHAIKRQRGVGPRISITFRAFEAGT